MDRRHGRARLLAVLGSLALGWTGPARAADDADAAVPILDAERRGLLTAEARGTGAYEVRVELTNRSDRRLRVVLPPGLVATSLTGQRGLLQDMGLGPVDGPSGSFGRFRIRSGADDSPAIPGSDRGTGVVTLPARGAVALAIPAICLNIGVPAPTVDDRLRLVDVDACSDDPRVRRSLRSLATLGTSLGVAQAVMWRVGDGATYSRMIARAPGRINATEMGLATRFLQTLDAADDPAGPATGRLEAGRVFATIAYGPATETAVGRLAEGLRGLRILGLLVDVVPPGKLPGGDAPMLHLGVTLAADGDAATTGKVAVRSASGLGIVGWSDLGEARFREAVALDGLDAPTLARDLDRALVQTFVTTRVDPSSSTWEIRNGLPFTLAGVAIRAGHSESAPLLEVTGLGIGPGRTARVVLPAAAGAIERVALNGL